MDDEKKIDFLHQGEWKHTMMIIVVALIALVILGIYLKITVFTNKEGTVTTISTASLKNVIAISELSTLDYTYNAIAKVYEEDGSQIKYYVSYEGKAIAGIDFDKIRFVVKEETKTVSIILPEVEIQDAMVDMGTLDYIFIKEKYNTETVSQEAYKASKADLEKRLTEETELYKMAKENAISAIKALYEPWIAQIDAEYTVEVR